MQGLFRDRDDNIDTLVPDYGLEGIEVPCRISVWGGHTDRFCNRAGRPADVQSERVGDDHPGSGLLQGAGEFEAFWQPPKCEKYRLWHLLYPLRAVQRG